MNTNEQQERIEVEKWLHDLGFETMYGGGEDDKGHGFWLKDFLNSATQEDMKGSTFHSMEECRTLIIQLFQLAGVELSEPVNGLSHTLVECSEVG